MTSIIKELLDNECGSYLTLNGVMYFLQFDASDASLKT